MRVGARRQPARRTRTLSRLSRAPTKQMGPFIALADGPAIGGSGLVRARNCPKPGFCSSTPSLFSKTWPRRSVIHGLPRACQPS